MKIAIAGSGAMGCAYGHMLHQAGNQVFLLDNWEQHITNINSNGLQMTEVGQAKVSHIPACRPEEFNQEVDLILLFTKSLALEAMLQQIQHLLKDNTKVLCLLNGLGHTETVSKFVKPENILMGVTVLTASLNAPGKVSFTSYGKTELQNIVANEEAQQMAQEVVATFNKAGLPCEYSQDIQYSIWRKACLNGAMNSLSTILDANMFQVGTYSNTLELIKTILREFLAIAQVEGVTFDVDEFATTTYGFTSPNFSGSVHYPSMHQDLIQCKRRTEVDYLNGYIARRGVEYGIATPYNDLITQLIHAKETILNAK